MATHCTECGWPLWSNDAKKNGLHPECAPDAIDALDSTAADLEDRLDDVLDCGNEA
jgi:hypothetical protein